MAEIQMMMVAVTIYEDNSLSFKQIYPEQKDDLDFKKMVEEENWTLKGSNTVRLNDYDLIYYMERIDIQF